jgi:hypothetical protein
MRMKQRFGQLKWLVLLLTSTLVLVWRTTDFIFEAVHEGFHMTRCGLAVWGADAEVLQLMIILVCIALIWKAIKRLAALQAAPHPLV